MRYAKIIKRLKSSLSSENLISSFNLLAYFERFKLYFLAKTNGTNLAKIKAMNFFDILIIYLACGAPFGVYYWINNRNENARVFIKSILISLFWIPFAFGLLQKYITKQLPNSILSKKEAYRDEEILETKKQLEDIFIKNKFDISVFELREIFDRYIGLTESALNHDEAIETNSQFFEIAGNENPSLAAKCNQRRNRKLLFFHQTLAGQDFLQMISEFVSRFPTGLEIENTSIKLAGLLNDEPTEKKLKLLFNKKQSRAETSVSKLEKESWINDLQPTPTANSLRISMSQAGVTTANSPIKD